MKRVWIELRQPQPLETVHGYMIAYFIIDSGMEHNNRFYGILQDEPYTGEWREVEHSEVRACRNWSLGRGYAKPLKPRHFEKRKK